MAAVKTKPSVAVVQFPGVNCEYETVRTLEASGMRGSVVRWNAPPAETKGAAAFVLPGGFSYEDRVRGGAIAAREPIMERLRVAAANGVPVLGICNGAQVLVEAGLVPGPDTDDGGEPVRMALARNRMTGRTGYYARWVFVEVTDVPCAFTTGLAPGTVVPMPVAHGEGRFTTTEDSLTADITAGRRVPLRYVGPDGGEDPGFPHNPNGAMGAAAGVVGRENVLALMPHPERAAWLWQVPPSLAGEWGERRRAWRTEAYRRVRPMDAAGPGRVLFDALARHLGVS